MKFGSSGNKQLWWVIGKPEEVEVGQAKIGRFDVDIKYVGEPYETPMGLRVRGYFDTAGMSAEDTYERKEGYAKAS